MADYEAKRIDEMEAAFLGSFKRARAELGVESFGMQVIDLPPNFDRYPAHDHTHDGQEEVFVAMRGGGEIEVGEERLPLDADHLVRVGPEAKRKVALRAGRDPAAGPRRRPRAGLRGAGSQPAGRAGPDGAARRAPVLAGPVSSKPAHSSDRDRRVAREALVAAGALAEREDRAAGVGDEALVAAAVAEAGRRAGRAGAHAAVAAGAAEHSRAPRAPAAAASPGRRGGRRRGTRSGRRRRRAAPASRPCRLCLRGGRRRAPGTTARCGRPGIVRQMDAGRRRRRGSRSGARTPRGISIVSPRGERALGRRRRVNWIAPASTSKCSSWAGWKWLRRRLAGARRSPRPRAPRRWTSGPRATRCGVSSSVSSDTSRSWTTPRPLGPAP